jgi:hypothetical protein
MARGLADFQKRLPCLMVLKCARPTEEMKELSFAEETRQRFCNVLNQADGKGLRPG